MSAADSSLPTFQAPFAPPDDELAARFLADAVRDKAAEAQVDARATRLVEAIRAKAAGLGGVEEFLHAYSLSTKEGLALMVLAEALLRVPDAATADRLIEDKLAAGRWLDSDVTSSALLVSASAWTLGVAARIIHPGETPESILDNIARRLGLLAVRTAIRQAMRLIGSHFVMGQTIEDALSRSRGHAEFRYSFDMLGEGARSAADADKYFNSYADAIEAIGSARRKYVAAGTAGHLGQALGTASALRSDLARASAQRADAVRHRACPHGAPTRSSIHHRRRRGRPARIVARYHRRGAGRWLAARLGRIWPGGAGLSEARAGRDRLGRGCCGCDTTAADGSSGQRRVLGHRDQARAGARRCRLPGLHPQGDDRPLLHGLRQASARGARPAISAIRHPQRAHGGECH